MGIRAFTSNGQRMSRSLEAVNAWTTEETEKMSLESSSRMSNSSSGVAQNADIYVLNSSIRSLDDQFLPDFQETLSQSLMDKLKNLSFADERILKTVTIYKDSFGSLGIQVTEGSDGKAYIQSVVPFGPASDTGNVFRGDQIVSVDGQNLLNLKYSDALQLLKKTDNKVELILSQISTSHCFQTPKKGKRFMEKFDSGRTMNFIDTSSDLYKMFKCNEKNEEFTDMYQCSSYNNIKEPKPNYQKPFEDHPPVCGTCTHEDSPYKCDITQDECRLVTTITSVPLPRSLGLGRRWRGPVRYPVTPVKHQVDVGGAASASLSDEEQIFI